MPLAMFEVGTIVAWLVVGVLVPSMVPGMLAKLMNIPYRGESRQRHSRALMPTTYARTRAPQPPRATTIQITAAKKKEDKRLGRHNADETPRETPRTGALTTGTNLIKGGLTTLVVTQTAVRRASKAVPNRTEPTGQHALHFPRGNALQPR